MMIWPISSKLKKVISQGVSWIIYSESIVLSWNYTILSTCFSSVILRLIIKDSFVHNTVREYFFVSFYSHNESSEIQVVSWHRLIPHFAENILNVLHILNMILKSLIYLFSVSTFDTTKYFIISSYLSV